jgi:hypothetical protein
VENGRFKNDPGDGTEVELESLGEATLTFVVPPGLKGEWEMGCFANILGEAGRVIATHYDEGMKGKLVVE